MAAPKRLGREFRERVANAKKQGLRPYSMEDVIPSTDSSEIILFPDVAAQPGAPTPKAHSLQDHSNLFRWTAYIVGPPDSPYEQFRFRLKLQIPRSYPLTPPKIHFVTKVCAGVTHPQQALRGVQVTRAVRCVTLTCTTRRGRSAWTCSRMPGARSGLWSRAVVPSSRCWEHRTHPVH